MIYTRLLFVTALLCALLHSERLELPSQDDLPPFVPPSFLYAQHESQEWTTFLDQRTGTWIDPTPESHLEWQYKQLGWERRPKAAELATKGKEQP